MNLVCKLNEFAELCKLHTGFKQLIIKELL